MKVSMLQENTKLALSNVSRAVAGRSTLPVLGCVLLATDNGRLKLTATNLEIGINQWIGAKVAEEGAICVPARLFTDLVNSLPPERIDLDLDVETQTLNIQCGRFKSNIKGMPAEEFPIVATEMEGGASTTLEADTLQGMVKQVIIAVATDESRPVLTGLLMQFNEDKLALVAADGFRLTYSKEPIRLDVDTESIIVPGRAMVELSRLLSDQEEPVEMVATKKQVLFKLTDAVLVSQLVEGKYPDFNAITPKNHSTKSILDTDRLLKAVKVAQLFSKESANIVKFTISPGEPGNIRLSAKSAELGDHVSDIEATITGEPLEIAFNAKYLIDGLSVIEQPQVCLQTSIESSPGLFYGVGDDDFYYVIMPMHINR